jgi:hypothetical protein
VSRNSLEHWRDVYNSMGSLKFGQDVLWHSKLRNSLNTGAVKKFVCIKTNYPTIADCSHVSDSEGMSSSE